ncbi:MAG: three-Cys-motif partner protein TcmP [Sedimentisphaerales bacterium]|nr:three-Cys-motif partner protein TcmP [Sedimentisphaerales bacterium]
MGKLKIDEVGYWSEVKLDLVKKYAQAYSTILNKQTGIQHLYIDGFAGAGVHISRTTGEYIPGSPLNALNIDPPFNEYHFIDLDGKRANSLQDFTEDNDSVKIYEGDCNEILLKDVFPRAQWNNYRRALCLLDPYGLHLKWTVLQAAGEMKSIEIFLNFPIMDMNMNVLKRNMNKVDSKQASRMDAFWGDQTWYEAAYKTTPGLFCDIEEKETNEALVQAFQKRLREVAGFKFVPNPIPMRNSKGATVYYLFFASPNKTGGKIVSEIFSKYKDRGLS